MGKYIRGISWGSAISVIVIMLALIFGSNSMIDQLFLYEVMPYYTVEANGESAKEVIMPANAQVYELAEASIEEIKEPVEEKSTPITYDLNKLKNINTLRQSFYSVDKKTGMTNELFDVDKLANTDVTIEKSMTEPKILIFHTHSRELFADSKDQSEGIVGAGEYLAQLMEEKYGVKCLHVTDSFDVVGGKPQTTGAYERMEPVIRKVLEENPSIEMVIDLHRDGVNEGVRLVSDIDGKPTAKVMLFNGLCKIWDNGRLVQAQGLENLYLDTNLALSFKMQLKANELYPTLNRKIYLNAYRYSLHMKAKSMLIELGAQTNTKEEAWNAVEKIAELINEVVFSN